MDGLARLLFAYGPSGPCAKSERRQGIPCHLARRAARFFARSAFATVARAKSPSDYCRLEEEEKSLQHYFKEFLWHHTSLNQVRKTVILQKQDGLTAIAGYYNRLE